jgi:hypothetical protein
LKPESFFIHSLIYKNIPTILCDGLPSDDIRHPNISFNKLEVHYGAVLSSFVCLELLGYAFLHPLEPYIPSMLSLHPSNCTKYASHPNHSDFCLLHMIESPYWPERNFHIHTQHPLELTEVLQGHDIPQFGPYGPHCHEYWSSKVISKTNNSLSKYVNEISGENHFPTSHRDRIIKISYCERWEDMVSDVDLFFQWAIANRLNKVEWLLLGNYKWGDELETRKKRLQVLTGIGHEYSLMIGVDCPIGNIQQHGWSIVDIHLPLPKQLKQIRYVKPFFVVN